ETLRIPKVGKGYIERYIRFKGKENLDNALKGRKGAIILGAHFGSWEICFAVAGILGYPLHVLTEGQAKNPMLDGFLNQTRQAHGVSVLKAGGRFRRIIRILQEGEFVGMVADHGIKEGVFVNFFGREVRTSALAVRVGIKFGVPILPVYLRRIKGPEHELVVLAPLKIKLTGNLDHDIRVNLEAINRIIEGCITGYPEQYLWFYKRFKYSRQRNILILHDGKAGHIRQVQAVLRLILAEAEKRNLQIQTKEMAVRFKNKLSSVLQSFSVIAAGHKQCKGCSWCVKYFLIPRAFAEMQSYFADIVISCGSSAAPVNLVVSGENQAKSVVLMRPGLLSTNRFDLVIMPAHDNPPKRDNVIVTDGALNLVNEEYIKSQVSGLKPQVTIEKDVVLGLLLGGDTKRLRLTPDLLRPLIQQVKLFLERNDAEILITTSRRTSPEVENLIKQEFGEYSRCKLLVIANEKNIPEAVGGILGLSKIVIVSGESISMVSEAASSGRYVIVFKPPAFIGKRHNRFLENLARKNYIYLADSSALSAILEEIIVHKPGIIRLKDTLKVAEAVGKLL
ncbi:MAG: ELM1/GtrOC1 family putative glycosyltransferase, partial [Candidatus Omnitrophota bacterium]